MKILHLYHDIMNLYGDYGNVKAVERILEKSGEDVTVERVSIGGSAELSDYDFIYIGSGTERNQKHVMEDFKRYSEQLSEAVKNGRVILMTGNSFEMLGSSVTDAGGKSYSALGLYGFETAEQNKTRNTADAVFEADFLSSPVVGFINKCSRILGIERPMFTVTRGLANSEGANGEGMRDKNLFMTHLTGPVLIKNPHFLEYIAQLILGRKPSAEHLEFERRGYDVTLRELTAGKVSQ